MFSSIDLLQIVSAIFAKIDTSYKGTIKAISAMIGMSLAILILAAALKSISYLSWEELGKGLVGVGALMGELLGFLAIMSTIDKKAKFSSVGIILLAAKSPPPITFPARAVDTAGESFSEKKLLM